MKSLDRISFLTNVLVVACQRPSTEVGKLVKALVTYATEGKRTELNDIRLETFFDLIVQDLDMQRMASEEKSRKCSESAKCRTAKSPAKPVTTTRKAVCESAQIPADVELEPTDADVEEVVPDANATDDVARSFERLKAVYGKTGNNELQAFELWKNMSEEERNIAFANAQLKQGDSTPRSYLDIYLSNKQWEKEERYKQANTIF